MNEFGNPVVVSIHGSEMAETEQKSDNLEVDLKPFNQSDKEILLGVRKQKIYSRILKVFVVFLGLLIVIGIVTSTVIMTFHTKTDQLGSLTLSIKLGRLTVQNAGRTEALRGIIGKGIVGGKIYKRRVTSDVLYYEWLNTANLRIKRDSSLEKCFNIRWRPGDSGIQSFQDCYSLKNHYIFGGSELYIQAWPLNQASIPMQQYVPRNILVNEVHNQSVYGPVLERYWLSSNGIAIIVNESVPLHVGFNENQTSHLCLKGNLQGYRSGTLQLTYRLCLGDNIKTLHQYVMGNIYKMPKSIPDERMIRDPMWSTSAIHGKAITQGDIEDFAHQIQQYNFSHSQIKIQDKYSTNYGEYEFDGHKFPNASAMITELHKKGFRVTAWVHPFTNTDAKAFLDDIQYWVRGNDPQVPGLVRWWNGIAAVWDLTNVEAIQTFTNRLTAFKMKYEIDAFRFDGGTLSYLPKDYHLLNLTMNNPSFYSTNYAVLASQFGPMVEVCVGFQTQELPIFIRILEQSSIWGKTNGLKSVIPTTLTLGILGYPFIIPGKVGGSGKQGKPDKELYIRWVQMNALLPAIQFSFTPWLYDNETINIVKKYVDLRAKLSSVLIQAAEEVSTYNAPIIRPLWWFAPTDDTSLTIDSEYIVGDAYLVAPVLDPYEVHKGLHKVYLPPGGKWRKEFGSNEIIDTLSKGKWITFTVKLEDLPYFSIMKNSND